MPFSYNLNTYSLQTIENWLSLIYNNQHLQGSIQHCLREENIPQYYPLNHRLGYLRLASGTFFNSNCDYQFLMPGDLLQSLASGLTDKEIMALCHNKVYEKNNTPQRKKTQRVLIIHESYIFAGIGSEIASMINREAYAAIKAPVSVKGTHHSVVPYQREAEAFALPSVSGIIDKALNILAF